MNFAMTVSANIIVYRPVESHSRARENILVGPPNILVDPLWGEIF